MSCLFGYSHDPRKCDGTDDNINFFLNPVHAIIKAAKGHRVEDTEPHQRTEERKKELFIKELEEEIKYFTSLEFPAIPASFQEAHSTPKPIESVTKLRSWDPETE